MVDLTNFNDRNVSSDYKYMELEEKPVVWQDKFKRVVSRTLSGELFVGLWVVFREMIKGNTHTVQYPLEKLPISPRYRALHDIKRLVESGNQACIGCGLCEKICISNCIQIDTKYGTKGRKVVKGYTINLGRCIYCGYCAEVCPELAITHGQDYENVCEQRAHFASMAELVTPMDEFKAGKQKPYPGFGALSDNADDNVKKTPLAY
ncbi:MAG: NADH-quinone oxidoreductase subunit NuoI [Epsilonproteobacteria bacterium]|nr:NADH-quinone oxidoreductase subunit NuoI [Campylobacterota bacterium]